MAIFPLFGAPGTQTALGVYWAPKSAKTALTLGVRAVLVFLVRPWPLLGVRMDKLPKVTLTLGARAVSML